MCVRTFNLFGEACLPREVVLTYNSKRQKRSTPTYHQSCTAGETPWRRYRWNKQTSIASNTDTLVLQQADLLLTTLSHAQQSQKLNINKVFVRRNNLLSYLSHVTVTQIAQQVIPSNEQNTYLVLWSSKHPISSAISGANPSPPTSI